MPRRRLALALLALAVAALLAAGLVARRTRPPAPAWGDEYDLTAARPEVIAPGTVVGTAPPDGWSHLVIKSLPRVRPGEEKNIPGKEFARRLVVNMASWMFTAFAVDVVPEGQGRETRYRLRAIGLGLGAKGANGDTVVTSDTAADHGVAMDLLKTQVLDTGYKVQGQAIVPVRGPSFALLDTPVIVRCAGKNRNVRYRYALLVDTRTGALEVLLWQLGAEGGQCADLSRAVRIEPNCIDEAELIPDPAEFNDLMIPTDLSFAVDALPPHRVAVPFPPDLAPLVAKTRFTADEARALEVGLRAMLAAQK